jgi:hypothetical protein
LAVIVALGGLQGAVVLRRLVKQAQRQQKQLCADVDRRPRGAGSAKVAVDKLFFRRLAVIFRM